MSFKVLVINELAFEYSLSSSSQPQLSLKRVYLQKQVDHPHHLHLDLTTESDLQSTLIKEVMRSIFNEELEVC